MRAISSSLSSICVRLILRAQRAGVDEERLAAPVALVRGGLVAIEEPQADGDPGRVEELAGQRDDAVDEVVADEALADRALAGLRSRSASRWRARSRRGRPGRGGEAKCWIQA